MKKYPFHMAGLKAALIGPSFARALAMVLALVPVALVAPVVHATDTAAEIRISYQPGRYWALPFHIATRKGWWAEVGLKPVMVPAASGAKQLAGLATKSWDVGAMGGVPALQSQADSSLRIIAIGYDESSISALVASRDVVAEFVAKPASLKGKPIALPQNSMAEFAVRACLRKYGLAGSDINIINMPPSDVLDGIREGYFKFGGLWAPLTDNIEEQHKGRVICTGEEAGAVAPSTLVAATAYAASNPRTVARFAAVYVRGWRWINANPHEAAAMLREFYNLSDIKVSDANIRKELIGHPTFDLAAQLKLMDRARGRSKLDGWFAAMADIMQAADLVRVKPDPFNFVTDEYLKLANTSPALHRFANRSD